MAVGGKAALVLLLFVMVANAVKGEMTCQMVMDRMTPCITYLTQDGPVPPECCKGVTSLYNDAYNAASTTTDRKTACQCLEKAAGAVPGIILAAASSLPGKCGVSIPYKISPDTDCSLVE